MTEKAAETLGIYLFTTVVFICGFIYFVLFKMGIVPTLF